MEGEGMRCEVLGGGLPGRGDHVGTGLKVKESPLGLKGAQ